MRGGVSYSSHSSLSPVNTRRQPNAGLTLGQRHRRWANANSPIGTTPRVCWEGCLNAGPGVGKIGHQIVARLATLWRVCVQLCRPRLHQQCSPSAVWRLAQPRRCANATWRRHVCIQYTVNLLLCRSNRTLAVHVYTSIGYV